MKKRIVIICVVIVAVLAVSMVFVNSCNQKKQFSAILDTSVTEITENEMLKLTGARFEKEGYKPYRIKLNLKNDSEYSVVNVSLDNYKNDNIVPYNLYDSFDPYFISSDSESTIFLCVLLKDGLEQKETDEAIKELTNRITLNLVSDLEEQPVNYDKTITISADSQSLDQYDAEYPEYFW